MHEQMNTPPLPAAGPSPNGDGADRKAALLLCALLLVSAPLLFGTVDRVFQIALTVLLGFGLLLVPWRPRLRGNAAWFALAFAAILLLQEFGPHRLFGHTFWRSTLTESFSLAFPFTHNPEPARALDALLAAAVAAVWFGWVRTLAEPRENRIFLAWSLFLSAAILAVVCFVMGQSSTGLIYGLRATPGWTGYGPFPNRNHTACFLAMGAVIGCGLVTRAASRKRIGSCFVAGVLLALVVVAMLWSKSRGGLMAFGFGFFLFVALSLLGNRSKYGVFAAVAGTLGVAALCLTFGAHVLERFAPGNDLPTNTRWDVWRDTLHMWRDAPLFGHGLGSFAQLFALYQSFSLEDMIVLHPESSWLLWLVELGAVPLILIVGALILFLARNLPPVFARQQGFFLAMGCLSAAGVLLCHSLWDVPGHRCATAAYGLAALALACPRRTRGTAENTRPSGRALAFVPLGIALFWSLPLLFGGPAWSPLALAQLLNRTAVSTSVSQADLENSLRFFPLNPDLHEAIGMREVNTPGKADAAWQHFRIADRLWPNLWELPAGQADASERRSPGMALHFWSLAIERAGHRGEEIFTMAVRDTIALPGAEAFWSEYASTNPQFCLSYAQNFAGPHGREYFTTWWNTRALSGQLQKYEVEAFYANASRWATRAQFNEWMKYYSAWEPQDYRAWVSLLQRWDDDAAAWALLSHAVKEPPFPGVRSSLGQSFLENEMEEHPNDYLNALALAELMFKKGDVEKSNAIILDIAVKSTAPEWFLKKGAYILARQRQFGPAVAMCLRSK